MSRAVPDDLPPGDFVFLGFLSLRPMTAYEIKKAMAVSVSFFWTAAHSQVYQQASRLLRDGYVREREVPGGRRKRVLSLTPRGRRAFAAWLQRPADAPELRDESLAKLFFGSRADRDALRVVLEDQRDLHAHRLAEYEGLRTHLDAAAGDQARYQRMTLELGLRIEHVWLAWLEDAIAELT